MRRVPLLLVLFVMLVCTPFAEACGPFRGFFQKVFNRPQMQQQQCEPVFPEQSQIGPVQGVPMQMPAALPAPAAPVQKAAPAVKTKIVYQQQCVNGVCKIVPVAVTDDADEKVVASVTWDF